MKTGKYMYGIVDSQKEESFGNIGVDYSEVYTIQYEDIGVVVSDIPMDYEIKIDEVRIHENVLRTVMVNHTIIPMSFGVVVKDEAEIENILKQARMKFKTVLGKIKNKLQINVTVSLDKNILAEISREDKEIQALIVQAKTIDADQNIKIELGSKVKTALDKRKNQYLKDIQNLIGTLADGFREKKNTDEYTVIDGSFLIDRSQEQRFYKRLNGIERKYEKKLTFLAVGPLPLYDFAEIEIRRIDFKCLDEARREIGLDNEVSLSEINSAYGQLSRKNHPDLHHEDSLAVEKFRKIKNAYEVLTKYCEHYMCSLEKSKVETILLIEEKSGWSLQNRRFQWDEQ